MSRQLLRAVARVLIGCLAVGGGIVLWSGTRGSDPTIRVVARSADGTTNTIEYDGIRVEVPADWRHVGADDCEAPHERWAPPEDPCNRDLGVGFVASATFDTAMRPRELRRFRDGGTNTWAGYVLVGDWAVSASTPERAVVQRVLASVRRTG